MTRDPLVRLLVCLAIAFVALEIAAVVAFFALFLFALLGGEPPMLHGVGHVDLPSSEGP